MNDLSPENFQPGPFDVTQDDLNGAADRLAWDGKPQSLPQIALGILQARLEQEAQQAEDILRQHGERILNLLGDALALDPRFTSIDDQWFLREKLPRLGHEILENLHQRLMQNPFSSVDEILLVLNEDGSTNPILWRMAVQAALHRWPERFENTGTAARPQWKALVPAVAQAEGTRYAYDPQTYEILCRPGQRLSEKKARRLQELDLYRHVVRFAR